jgi:hypothetical protein
MGSFNFAHTHTRWRLIENRQSRDLFAFSGARCMEISIFSVSLSHSAMGIVRAIHHWQLSPTLRAAHKSRQLISLGRLLKKFYSIFGNPFKVHTQELGINLSMSRPQRRCIDSFKEPACVLLKTLVLAWQARRENVQLKKADFPRPQSKQTKAGMCFKIISSAFTFRTS